MALVPRTYRIVRGDGSVPERIRKHPFCMSRVYYQADERPEELWAEQEDGSVRWRQTGSEVHVIALQVRLAGTDAYESGHRTYEFAG